MIQKLVAPSGILAALLLSLALTACARGDGADSTPNRTSEATATLPLPTAIFESVELPEGMVTLPSFTPTPTTEPGPTATTIPKSTTLVDDPEAYARDTLDVLEVHVTVFESPDGTTLEDLNNDTDFEDDFKARVPVLFQSEDFAQGADKPNRVMQIGGHSTREADQKSYGIILDSGNVLWEGHRSINLNKHPYDLTRVRNKISFDYFKEIPHLTSLRTQFVNLFINEEDLRLFTLIEEPGHRFLGNHGLDPEGFLYKAWFFEFFQYPDELRLADDLQYDRRVFESILGIRGNEDHAKVIAMLDDVNNFDISINTVMATHFNRDNYLTWFAINLLFENLDTNSQNFYLYSSTISDTWYFLPRDYDDAWGFYEQPGEVLFGSALPRWQQGISNWWGVVLHRRFVSEPENLADLLERVDDLFETIVTPQRTGELLESYRSVIESYLFAEPDVDYLPIAGPYEEFASEFAGEYERLITLPAIHVARLLETLERPMPVYLGDVIVEDEGLLFQWDQSFDLQGDGITYGFEVSRGPSFDPADVFIEQLDLEVRVTEPLEAGDYYWRVITRDTKDPEENWQIAFDSFGIFDGEEYRDYHGTRMFTVD